ncbi:16S rRNA (cytidine(1402)-2'-O)-methyltransferase [soil metagenome]
MTEVPAGKLVLVATPIGNLGDLSPRAAAALAEADVVAAEDTRRSGRLLGHAGASTVMVSYHEHNEETRGRELLDRVAAGEMVVVISDAGTPAVADPGYRIVREAVARGLDVTAIPGPAAALQALILSGLPTDRFAFEGFLPRKAGLRDRRLAELAADPRTLVLYVPPHRAAAELRAMAAAFGAERPAALARELTKLHEEVWHGRLGQLAERAGSGVRGEVTVVVGGAPADATGAPDVATLVARVERLVAGGRSRRDAVAEVAAATGASRRELYQAVLDASAPPQGD